MKREPAPGRQGRHHGGPLDPALVHERPPSAGGPLLDFSVNLNPYGPAPEMQDAIRNADPGPYPDSTARAAREALAQVNRCPGDRIVVGPGAADLLWTLARALVGPGEVALHVEPTFSEMRHAVTAARGEAHEWRARPESGFAVDLAAVAAEAHRARARLVYLGNPNNPTGRAATARELTALAAALPATTTLVVDESFLSLSALHAEASTPLPETVVRVRSLTKDHAIAGVRVGYLIAPAPLAARLEEQRPAWATGAAAQAAALASTRLGAFVAASRERVLEDLRALDQDLRALGLAPVPSTTCFCLVPVPVAASELRGRLLERHGILVRDCSSFGLGGFIRLAARPRADRRRLVEALKRELS